MADSIFKRSLQLTKLAAQVGFQELRSKDIKSRIAQARAIAESLSQLKGAAMKAGQLLSIELDDYFPPEAVQILSQLQSGGTEVSLAEITKTLKKELGPERFKKIEDISARSLASASIAQIHTANYLGERVVLKVQHVGVAQSINSDIALLKKVAQSLMLIGNRKMNLNPLFDEMKEVLNQEVDFAQEVKYLKKYRKNLRLITTKDDKYYSPEPIETMSTKKVIVMTFEDGVTINSWLNTNPSQRKKEKLAHLVLNLYCNEFYRWGLVQTDPNFANFLIREVGEDIGLVLLDFGATREYEKDFIRNYLDLLQIVRDGDTAKIIQAGIDFELIDRRESKFAMDKFIELLTLAVEPFKASSSSNKFSFGDKEYNKRSKEVVKEFVLSLKFTPPPSKLLFLHRKLAGISSLLRRLDVHLDITPYWIDNYR